MAKGGQARAARTTCLLLLRLLHGWPVCGPCPPVKSEALDAAPHKSVRLKRGTPQREPGLLPSRCYPLTSSRCEREAQPQRPLAAGRGAGLHGSPPPARPGSAAPVSCRGPCRPSASAPARPRSSLPGPLAPARAPGPSGQHGLGQALWASHPSTRSDSQGCAGFSLLMRGWGGGCHRVQAFRRPTLTPLGPA